MSAKTTPNEIVFYESSDGKVSIAVRFEEDNIWLTQKQKSELFDCSTDNVSLQLKNIYSTGELNQDSTTENFSVVQQEGHCIDLTSTNYAKQANRRCQIRRINRGLSDESWLCACQRSGPEFR